MKVADGIPVHCSCSDIVHVSNLTPHPKNPNVHPPEQIRILSGVILFQGWRVPITVSNLTGFIVRGHGRLMAAELMGWSEVPVDYQDYDDEISELEDLLADNQIPELASLSESKLKEIIERLDGQIGDLEVLGFSMDRLEELILDPSEVTTGGVWGNPQSNPADAPEFVTFRFGVISGLVSQDVYDQFVTMVKKVSKGESTMSLTEIVRRWIDGKTDR